MSAQDSTELASHDGRHINPVALLCNLLLTEMTIRMGEVRGATHHRDSQPQLIHLLAYVVPVRSILHLEEPGVELDAIDP